MGAEVTFKDDNDSDKKMKNRKKSKKEWGRGGGICTRSKKTDGRIKTANLVN